MFFCVFISVVLLSNPKFLLVFFFFCVFIDIPWQYILNKNLFISDSNPERSQYGIFLLFFQMALHDKLCPTLCSPMNCSLPGSFIHGILQARIFLTQGSNLHLMSPAMVGMFFTTCATREALQMALIILKKSRKFLTQIFLFLTFHWEIIMHRILKKFLVHIALYHKHFSTFSFLL